MAIYAELEGSDSFDLNPQVGPVPRGFTPGRWVGDAKPNPAYRLDVNQGVHIRFIGDTGEAIYMFVDKPGVYYNEVGRVVREDLAAAAGFDTERLGYLRRRNEARSSAIAAVDAEFGLNQRTIVVERGEYRVVELRPGFFNVEFDDGTVMNAKGPIPEDMAMKLFRQCLNEPEPEPESAAVVSQPAADAGPKKKAS